MRCGYVIIAPLFGRTYAGSSRSLISVHSDGPLL